MNEVINKQAVITMVDKIVEELEELTVGVEEKKAWARALIETILPVEEEEK